MRSSNAALACVLGGLFALAACTDSSHASDAAVSDDGDAAGGKSGSGGGGKGAANGSGGAAIDQDQTCSQLADQAGDAVQRAVDKADLSCSAKSDCEVTENSTSCHPSCGALVSKTGRYAVQTAIDTTNTVLCTAFSAQGCKAVIPPCEPPGDFGCVGGRCQWLDGSDRDASVATGDAAVSGDAGDRPGCLSRAIGWTTDGGLVAFRDAFELEPCRAFSFARVAGRGTQADASCSNEVASGSAISVDDVDAALADPDVKAAITAAPVLYGGDSRPVDGTVFRIEIGSAVIDVGNDCNGSSACKPIPAGVNALRALLIALGEQQMKLPTCDDVEP